MSARERLLSKIALREEAGGEKGAALAVGVKLDASSDKSASEQLRELLTTHMVRVVDLFHDWDDDEQGTVSKKEFRKGLAALGLDAPQAAVDALFDSFDRDRSGSISYKELNSMLPRSGVELDDALQPGAAGAIILESKNSIELRHQAGGEKGAALGLSVKLDTSSDKSVQEQLREVLKANMVRVMDLFRDWDDDGRGTVSKKEFRKGLAALGLGAEHRADVDGLFDSLDRDGSLEIEFKELNSLLHASPTCPPQSPVAWLSPPVSRRQSDAEAKHRANAQALGAISPPKSPTRASPGFVGASEAARQRQAEAEAKHMGKMLAHREMDTAKSRQEAFRKMKSEIEGKAAREIRTIREEHAAEVLDAEARGRAQAEASIMDSLREARHEATRLRSELKAAKQHAADLKAQLQTAWATAAGSASAIS